MDKRVERVLKIAAKEVGVREYNDNSGKRVMEYQAATTLGGTHWPWCAAFCSWAIREGIGVELMRQVWMPSASCDIILDWARRKGIISGIPEVGSAGLVMASRYDATHIFLVESINGNNTTTLEGNTNAGGSRNGNGVYRRVRPVSLRYLYAHWHRLLSDNVSAEPAKWALYFGDKKASDLDFIDGTNWLPAWKWAQWMKMSLAWDVESQAVVLNGDMIPHQVKFNDDGRALLPIRTLVGTIPDLKLKDDTQAHRVIVTK